MRIRAGDWPFLALAFAGLLGASGVAIGAWAAHGIAVDFGEHAARLFRTAVPWQMWHALALAMVAVWRIADSRAPGLWTALAAAGFAVGSILFCGALYASAIAPAGPLRYLAPFGGLFLIAAWLALAAAGVLRLARR